MQLCLVTLPTVSELHVLMGLCWQGTLKGCWGCCDCRPKGASLRVQCKVLLAPTAKGPSGVVVAGIVVFFTLAGLL